MIILLWNSKLWPKMKKYQTQSGRWERKSVRTEKRIRKRWIEEMIKPKCNNWTRSVVWENGKQTNDANDWWFLYSSVISFSFPSLSSLHAVVCPHSPDFSHSMVQVFHIIIINRFSYVYYFHLSNVTEHGASTTKTTSDDRESKKDGNRQK